MSARGMTPRSIEEAWKIADEVKGKPQAADTPEQAQDLGREWFMRLALRYDLTPEDLLEIIRIDDEIGDHTIETLHAMRDSLTPATILKAIHASGFSNGLALGFERYRED